MVSVIILKVIKVFNKSYLGFNLTRFVQNEKNLVQTGTNDKESVAAKDSNSFNGTINVQDEDIFGQTKEPAAAEDVDSVPVDTVQVRLDIPLLSCMFVITGFSRIILKNLSERKEERRILKCEKKYEEQSYETVEKHTSIALEKKL
jgi:hypothetical protein